MFNKDLEIERKKCEFNIEELTNLLDGNAEYTAKRREIENIVLSHKVLKDEVPEEFLSHKEKYENAVRKSVLLHKIMLKTDYSVDIDSFSANFRNMVSHAVFKENSPFMLHFGMFIQAIQGQGTKEQVAYWMDRVNKNEIIGTYAQTELGHGTFLRGLETRATYDPKTEQFTLNSPSITAFKWWPGGLGHTANYCIVMAQLYINNKRCGIQPFMVQIRDEETHMPLPGIKVGEIGAKFGFNTVNNGFLGFENYKLARDKMLMKNAQVLKDGTFKESPNSKLTYGTMVYSRVIIVNTAANQLAKAVTIAVRYAAVRRQSQLKPDEPEPQIMDYVTQQHKLFIAIATSHAFLITARWLWNMYHNFTKDLATGNLQRLPELHSLSCCLKAVSTSDCSQLIETCRRACGGHGYMLSSNLPQIYSGLTAACTYEGENTVLMLQTARSLVKAWNQLIVKGELLRGSMWYLADRTPVKPFDTSVQSIIRSFQLVSRSKLAESVKGLRKYTESGLSAEDAWNMTSVQLVAAAEAHCRVVILSAYKSEVDNVAATLSGPLKRVLGQLVELYAIYWALERLGDLLLYTNITGKDVRELRSKYEDLLGTIRPNAVGLVDAFDIRDEILCSTLGAYDGRVYERLMEEALKSPLNAEPVNQSFHKYLKPFMQGKL